MNLFITAKTGITDDGVTTVYEISVPGTGRMFASEDIDLALTYVKSFMTGGTN